MGSQGDNVIGAISQMSDSDLQIITQLIDATLEKSYPEEWKENQDELQQFGLKYMNTLLPKIFEANNDTAGKITDKQKELMDRIQDGNTESIKG